MDRRVESLERHMAQVMAKLEKMENLLDMRTDALPVQKPPSPYKRLGKLAVSVRRPTTVSVEPIRLELP